MSQNSYKPSKFGETMSTSNHFLEPVVKTPNPFVSADENRITFTVLGKAEPQGSIKEFVVNGRARLTSDNTKMKPWRQAVGFIALEARPTSCIWAGKHVPVAVDYHFYFARPTSAPKSRIYPVTKPDWDKIARSCSDAMTGIIYLDDAQIVDGHVRKEYGWPERTEVTITKL
jgi:Holliday junction resolvase RusA-like endonuclease